MASELRVDTLKDASGNNSIGLSYVAEGSEKSWWSLNGTGTIAFRDSFNTSGSTDLGTGDYKVAFTNNMSTANYSALGNGGTTDTNWNGQHVSDVVMGGNIASGVFTAFYDTSGIGFANYNNNSPNDTEIFNGAVLGDLA